MTTVTGSVSGEIHWRTRVARALRGFVTMPIREKMLLFAAWMVMGMFACVLRLVHFRSLAPLLGERLDTVAWIPLASTQQIYRARMVRRAVLRAARLAFFRSDCLPQALVAAMLCRRLGVPVTVHLGVKIGTQESPISAHAWSCSGHVVLTGGYSFNSYTPVSCFASMPEPGRERINTG